MPHARRQRNAAQLCAGTATAPRPNDARNVLLGAGYVEIISCDRLLRDAKRRNRVLFEQAQAAQALKR